MNAGLSFRRAGPADASAIHALTRQAYSKWIAVIGREPLPMTFDYREVVLRHRIELALLERNVAGLIEWAEKPDHLLIENLAVMPEHQGAGIGAALLAHCEAMALSAGHRDIRLYTNQKFVENIRYYAKRGFGVFLEEPFMGGTVVHMAKQIA